MHGSWDWEGNLNQKLNHTYIKCKSESKNAFNKSSINMLYNHYPLNTCFFQIEVIDNQNQKLNHTLPPIKFLITHSKNHQYQHNKRDPITYSVITTFQYLLVVDVEVDIENIPKPKQRP